jgi:LysM repeat protein
VSHQRRRHRRPLLHQQGLVVFVLFLAARAAWAEATPEAATQSAETPEHRAWHGDLQAYTVRTGDTAWRIAARHYTSVDQLLAMNEQLEDAERLYPGQHLLVPDRLSLGHRDTQNETLEPSCELLVALAAEEITLPEPMPEPAVATPTPEENENHHRLIYADRVSAPVAAAIIALARRLEMNPDHLMTIMHYETGGSFRPSVRNPHSSAVGLIQFLPSTARFLGTTDAALEQMTALEQLEWVERYLRPFRGRLVTLEDAYMAVLYPVAVGQPDDFILFRRGSRSYERNSYLDRDEDGEVRKGEVGEAVRRVFEAGLAELREASAAASPSE